MLYSCTDFLKLALLRERIWPRYADFPQLRFEDRQKIATFGLFRIGETNGFYFRC